MADRYYNPILTRFLAPIDCLKIPSTDRSEIQYSNDTFERFIYVLNIEIHSNQHPHMFTHMSAYTSNGQSV